MPPHLLPAYASLITRHTSIELASLATFYREAAKSPFRSLPWRRGVLRLRLAPLGAAAPPGAPPPPPPHPPLAALHMHRKVLAVVGVAHAPSWRSENGESSDPTHGLRAAADAFVAAARTAAPDAAVLRLFAFEVDPEAAAAAGGGGTPPGGDASPSRSASGGDSLRYVMPFPPTAPPSPRRGAGEGGDDNTSRATSPARPQSPPADPATALAGHAAVLMCELAAALLAELERYALSASPAAMALATDADGDAAGCAPPPAPGDDDASRRRRYARLAKALGDAALLAGSPRDAATHHSTAADLARTAGDGTWAAAALEGLAAANALALLLPRTGSGDGVDGGGGEGAASPRVGEVSPSLDAGDAGDDDDALWRALRGAGAVAAVGPLLAEARATARRRCGPALAVGFAARSARFLARASPPTAARAAVGALAAECAAAVPSIPSPVDRLAALAEAADVASLAGLARKRALLLWQAVELCHGAADPDARVLADALAALMPVDGGGSVHGGGAGSSTTTGIPAHWPVVAAGALEGALSAAIASGAHASVWDAAAALLSRHAPLLPASRQDVLARTLDAAAAQMAAGDRARPGVGAGPPPLLAWVATPHPSGDDAPRPLEKDGWPAPRGRSKGRGDGPFIFSALGGERRAAAATPAAGPPPTFAAGEPVRVDVEVTNPASIPVQVERLTLEAELVEEAAGSGGGGRGTTARSRAWRPAPVALWLPPSTPPTVVSLGGTPTRPGTYRLLGCRVVARGGVSWMAPFGARRAPPPRGTRVAARLGLAPPRPPPPADTTLTVCGALPRLSVVVTAPDTSAGPHPAADAAAARPRDPGERDDAPPPPPAHGDAGASGTPASADPPPPAAPGGSPRPGGARDADAGGHGWGRPRRRGARGARHAPVGRARRRLRPSARQRGRGRVDSRPASGCGREGGGGGDVGCGGGRVASWRRRRADAAHRCRRHAAPRVQGG